MPTLDDLQARGLEIAHPYDELNLADRGRTRSDVGGRDDLAHELSDCLWSVLVLADHYDIDLATACTSTMDDLSTPLGG